MSDIPACPGIYKITCTANGRFYIGSSFNMRKRKNEHWGACRRNEHGNAKIQRAWNKYGEQAFAFKVFEPVLEVFRLEREQYWLDKLKPFGRKGFNIARKAEASPNFLGHKHSDKTKVKMSQASRGKPKSPEHVEHQRQAQRGRKPSLKCLEAGRQASLGNKYCVGRVLSQETKDKIRQAHLGKVMSPEARKNMKGAHRNQMRGADGKFV